jgi:putative ABC transport system permease protein
MGSLRMDLRYALRMMRKNPGFTATVVLVLALGIGANTAIFSLVDVVLFRPLAIQKPQEVVRLMNGETRGKPQWAFASFPQYTEYRDHASSFSGLAAFVDRFPVNVSDTKSVAQRVSAGMVTGNYFLTLGVAPAAGRVILPDDDHSGAAPVAMLGYDLWRGTFHSDPAAIRSSILVDGRVFEVVGITPPGFYGVDLNNMPQIWIPAQQAFTLDPLLKSQIPLGRESFSLLGVVGRLKKGVSASQAQAELEILALQLGAGKPVAGDAPDFKRPWPSLVRAETAATQDRTRAAWLILSIVFVVLLIACADVAGLMLARSESRQKEVAIRMAMGASRGQVISGHLVEGLLLSGLGALGGGVVAQWGTHLLIASSPGVLPIPLQRAASILDVRVLGFVGLTAVLCAIATSLLPALRYSRPDLLEAMKRDTYRASFISRRTTVRDLMVVLQVTASVVLLIAAGLLMRTLWQASHVRLGFDAEHGAGASTDPIREGYKKEAGAALLDPLLDALRKQPGVQFAAIGGLPTLGGFGTVIQAGRNDQEWTSVKPVSESYFVTTGIPLLSGRDFARSDNARSARVAIVNQAMADVSWPNQNAVGQLIKHVGPKEEDFQVVGIAGNVVSDRRSAPRPSVYVPISQSYLMFPWQPDVTLLARSTGDPSGLVPAIRAAIASVDPNLPVFHIRTFQQQAAELMADERFLGKLLAVFAALATVLSASGVYGLVSYTTENRTREFGIRVALGADPQEVFWMVLRKGLLLTGSGLVLGLATAAMLTRFLVAVLYGVTPSDTVTFLGVAVLMTIITVAAIHPPANRATHVDPMFALRDE